MSVADRLGREAQEFLALGDADYSVTIEHASSYDWFYVHVCYREKTIYRKACCKSFRMARWRVRRTVKHHRRFIAAMHSEGVRP